MNDFIDARGKLCPLPIILLRKALDKFLTKEFNFILDNEISYLNVKRYLEEKKIQFDVTSNGKEFTFQINKKNNFAQTDHLIPTKITNISINSGTTLCFKTQIMGDGDKELGSILMSAFINNLTNCTSSPEYIVCYNSGVFLCTQNSAVFAALKNLENSGVKILICGVCVEFFNLKDLIAVGTISNMYEISEVLLSSKNIIYP